MVIKLAPEYLDKIFIEKKTITFPIKNPAGEKTDAEWSHIRLQITHERGNFVFHLGKMLDKVALAAESYPQTKVKAPGFVKSLIQDLHIHEEEAKELSPIIEAYYTELSMSKVKYSAKAKGVEKKKQLTQKTQETAAREEKEKKKGNKKPAVSEYVEKETIRIMTEGDPVEYLMNGFNRSHLGDYYIGLMLLISVGIQSVLNSKGLHPYLTGFSGAGKTHAAKATAHMMPKEYLYVGTLSPKALYYYNILPGTVIFSDDINLSEGMDDTIKRATSDYQERTKQLVVKNQETEENEMAERLSWWLTGITETMSKQTLNRTIGGELRAGDSSDHEVAKWNKKKMAIGEVELVEDTYTEICRNIIRKVKRQLFYVSIPFINDLGWNNNKDRRSLPLFGDIIMSFAAINFMQRENDGKRLIATEDDYINAKTLYLDRQEHQTLKLSGEEERILSALRENGALTRDEIATITRLRYKRVVLLLEGNIKFSDSGLLSNVVGLIKRYPEEDETGLSGSTRRANTVVYEINEYSNLGETIVDFSEQDAIASIERIDNTVNWDQKKVEIEQFRLADICFNLCRDKYSYDLKEK